jgi:hypothetical protein
MSGPIREHTLVYTVVLASLLAAFFDLSRIASLGAFLYLIMDILIHLGVFRTLRRDIGARGWVLITAIVLDVGVLGAFGAMKLQSDPLIVIVAAVAITAVFGFQRIYLGQWTSMRDDGHVEHKSGGL